mmetsp:Transcript_1198/g.2583  ORF Transcript_1198/g.2583 Transcript_1198/m.2583 type:complete len:311 (-) Transcript_1198:57-989(-)
MNTILFGLLLDDEYFLLRRNVVRHQVLDDVHDRRQRSPRAQDPVLEPVLPHLHTVNLLDPRDEVLDLVLLDLHVVVLIAPDHHLQQILEDVRPQILLHLPQNIPVLLHLLREGRHALPLRLRDHVQRLLHVLELVDRVAQLPHRLVQPDVLGLQAIDLALHGLVRLLERDDVGELRLLPVGVGAYDGGQGAGDEDGREGVDHHGGDGRPHGDDGHPAREYFHGGVALDLFQLLRLLPARAHRGNATLLHCIFRVGHVVCDFLYPLINVRAISVALCYYSGVTPAAPLVFWFCSVGWGCWCCCWFVSVVFF